MEKSVWVILWHYSDHSGSGMLPYAYTDKHTAEHVYQLLNEDFKVFGIQELRIIDGALK